MKNPARKLAGATTIGSKVQKLDESYFKTTFDHMSRMIVSLESDIRYIAFLLEELERMMKKGGEMHEYLVAWQFYRTIVSALTPPGIQRVSVYMDKDGELVAEGVMGETMTEEQKREEWAENQLAIKEAFYE